MTLGERIKQARLEKGMSQRQLCGNTITRNMLSLIENGSARPSMDTLCYFAQQLDKPVSYFLDEQAVVSPNQAVMEQARQQFAGAQYRQAAQTLETYKAPDGTFDAEYWLLHSLCAMELAAQAQAEGKTVYAAQLLEKAEAAGAKTPYFTAAHRRQWVLLAAQTHPDRAGSLVQLLPADDRELLLRAQAAMDTGDLTRCACILDAAQNRDARWHYLRGQAAMALKDYETATLLFHRAEATYPLPCAKALEECYRELENFKMAYLYACKLREL